METLTIRNIMNKLHSIWPALAGISSQSAKSLPALGKTLTTGILAIALLLIYMPMPTTQAQFLPNMVLYALNKGSAKVWASGLHEQTYFHAHQYWYANVPVSLTWTELDSNGGYYESFSIDHQSGHVHDIGSLGWSEIKDWDFAYHGHLQGDEAWEHEWSLGESFAAPDKPYITTGNARTYSMTYRIKSHFTRKLRAPVMPGTYTVTLRYHLEDLSYPGPDGSPYDVHRVARED
ncbi:MAG: hypothetical protein M2R45_02185 [Verrucomicrobia subdivision 3 bacterium]|nr:hypothetical protein [Limisphaerales bacterium]MCS1413761.1 hypothetical protein [Limisphaerales bacterium]